MQMRHKFETAGGKVLEKTMAQGVRIHPDGVALLLQGDQHDVTGQLLIDCMGNFSPVVRQVWQLPWTVILHDREQQVITTWSLSACSTSCLCGS